MENVKLPNLFLLGPAKTATTSLAYWLSQHNNIFVSEPKETLYFEFEYDRGVNYYLHKYFRHQNGEQVVVDGRPMHLVVGYCAERIKETCPNAKFVVVLRHPVGRAYSDWGNWQRMRPGRAHKTFHKAIRYNIENFSPEKFDLEGNYVPFCDSKGGSYVPTYLEASLYGRMLRRYIDIFGMDKFLILDFDDVTQYPQTAINQICYFMGIDDQKISDIGERNMMNINHARPTIQGIIAGMSRKQTYYTERMLSLFESDRKVLLKYCDDVDFTKEWEL